MELDAADSFNTAETVPGVSPTRSATAFKVTLPGTFCEELFFGNAMISRA
jgi:hypothetical protein